jgi:hypothetical protein
MSIVLRSVILDKVSPPLSDHYNHHHHHHHHSTINVELQVEIQTQSYVYEVGLHGSNDDWQTIIDIETFHYVRHGINGAQIWKLVCSNSSIFNKDKLIFALYAKVVNGETLWDNNDGHNYTLFDMCHHLGHTNHNVKVWYGDKVVSFA